MSDTRFSPTRTVVKQYMDVETGEIRHFQTDEAVPVRRRVSEAVDEDFIMLFPKALLTMYERLPGMRVALFAMLVINMDPRTGETRYTLAELAQQFNTPDTYISRMIREMCDAGVLTKLGRGKVAVNPQIGWRGSLAKRRELIRAARKESN